MHGQGMCGGGCGGYDSLGEWSHKDQIAFLEEREKIMEAKLATIRHFKEELQSKQADKK
jgi:hypothetical protein